MVNLMNVTYYRLNSETYLAVNHDDDSITFGTYDDDSKSIYLSSAAVDALVEHLIDHNFYDPWMV